jgi:hypothetical protein
MKEILIKMSNSDSREVLKNCLELCMSGMKSGAITAQDAKDIACEALLTRLQLTKEKLAEYKKRNQ